MRATTPRRLAPRAVLACALLLICTTRLVAASDHGGGDGGDGNGHGRGCGKPDPAFQAAMQQMLSAAAASGSAPAASALSSTQLNGATSSPAAASTRVSDVMLSQLQGGQLACALAVSSQAASSFASAAIISLQSPLRLSAATCNACGAASYCPVGVGADGTMAARPSAFFSCAPGGDVAATATSGGDAMQYCSMVPSRLTIGLATALPLAAVAAALLCCCRFCRCCPLAKRCAAAHAADLEAAQRAVVPPVYVNAMHGKAMQGDAAPYFVVGQQGGVGKEAPAYGAPQGLAPGVPVYYPEVPVYAAELQRR